VHGGAGTVPTWFLNANSLIRSIVACESFWFESGARFATGFDVQR
jgi:hypothetical protein